MAEVGNTFLKLIFAVMAIIAARYVHSNTSLFVAPLLMFHFIFDTSFAFVAISSWGGDVFQAHHADLHHLLNRSGF